MRNYRHIQLEPLTPAIGAEVSGVDLAAGMSDDVLDRPVILLDDGSNVIGLESMRSLLDRHPPDAWSQP